MSANQPSLIYLSPHVTPSQPCHLSHLHATCHLLLLNCLNILPITSLLVMNFVNYVFRCIRRQVEGFSDPPPPHPSVPLNKISAFITLCRQTKVCFFVSSLYESKILLLQICCSKIRAKFFLMFFYYFFF